MNAADLNARAVILPTGTGPEFRLAVERAARELRAGGVVALPTETVYGLAANALDPAAVSRIYQVKGRPAGNPLIVHVSGEAMARRCARQWPVLATRLAAAFWPGPLTLVVPRSAEIPDIVTAGGETVALRWPAHPVMQAVIEACGFPLAAPSANQSNQISPTTAHHVRGQLGDRIPLILDGGASQVGIESTVLDLGTDPPRVLRPGMIHDETIRAVTGALGETTDHAGGVLRSPGQLARHYSPRARLIVRAWKDQAELEALCAASGVDRRRLHILAHTRISGGGRPVTVLPREPEALGRALYAELHRCDEAGAELILFEALPDQTEWRGLRDRLSRASAP